VASFTADHSQSAVKLNSSRNLNTHAQFIFFEATKTIDPLKGGQPLSLFQQHGVAQAT
jgi:hypothetical protein